MNLRNKHFYLTIKDKETDCIIKERKASGNKTPLYIWDLTRMCYISGLKQTSKNTFIFNIRGKESDVLKNYQLTISESGGLEVTEIEG